MKTVPVVQQRRSSQDRPTDHVEVVDMPEAVTETEDLFAVLASTGPDVETTLAEASVLEASVEGDDDSLARQMASAPAPRDELLRVYLHALRAIPLLDRHGEVAVAQRIERAHMDRLILMLQSPLRAHILGTVRARLQHAARTLAAASVTPGTSVGAAAERVQALLATLTAFTQTCGPPPGQTAPGGQPQVTAADAVAFLHGWHALNGKASFLCDALEPTFKDSDYTDRFCARRALHTTRGPDRVRHRSGGGEPYNATFFSPPFLGVYDARERLGDCAVGPTPPKRGALQSSL